MRPLLPLLALLLLASAPAGPDPATAPPKKPKPARALRLSYLPCPAAGTSCRLILSWTRPNGYVSATDTAKVDWDQTGPTAFPDLRVVTTRGAADTIQIARPAAGKSKVGVVTLCYVRAGWIGQACNSPLGWSVESEVIPPDTATGLQVVGLRSIPVPYPYLAVTGNRQYRVSGTGTDACAGATTISAGGRMATGCPSATPVQWCSAMIRRDSAVVWNTGSKADPACAPAASVFAAMYGARWHPDWPGQGGSVTYALERIP